MPTDKTKQFIMNNLEFSNESYITAKTLMDQYRLYTGSSTGKQKLYSELVTNYGVQKVSNVFLGVRMIHDTASKRTIVNDAENEDDGTEEKHILEPTDESTSESTNELTDESTSEQTDESTNELTDELTNESTGESTDELIDEATDELIDELTHESTDELTDVLTDSSDTKNGKSILLSHTLPTPFTKDMHTSTIGTHSVPVHTVDACQQTDVYTVVDIPVSKNNDRLNSYNTLRHLMREHHAYVLDVAHLYVNNPKLSIEVLLRSGESVIDSLVASNERIASMFISSNERRLSLTKSVEREDNGKNRCLFSKVRTHRFIDIQPYGTPSMQYIPIDNLVDVIGFTVFESTNYIDNGFNKLIRHSLDRYGEDHYIYMNGTSMLRNCVSINDAIIAIKEMMAMRDIHCDDACDDNLCNNMCRLIFRIESVKDIASRDNNRQLPSVYQECKSNISGSTKRMPKSDYVKPCNKPHSKLSSEGIFVHCYVCNKKVAIESKACHRSHNIPQSDNGDWSFENIFLCCATCNSDMSDAYTVMEYKADRYSRLIYKK